MSRRTATVGLVLVCVLFGGAMTFVVVDGGGSGSDTATADESEGSNLTGDSATPNDPEGSGSTPTNTDVVSGLSGGQPGTGPFGPNSMPIGPGGIVPYPTLPGGAPAPGFGFPPSTPPAAGAFGPGGTFKGSGSNQPSSSTTPAQTTVPNSNPQQPGQSPAAPPQDPPVVDRATTTTTTVDYPVFQCAATVSLFAGDRTGSLRWVRVTVALSTDKVPAVWAKTTWDENTKENVLTLNPLGQGRFLVSAPGTEWPTVRVFATADMRPSSQMCNG